jgi:hypothetical protein
VLVVDETGDLKKGSHTVGVGRQYTGTAGKVDNAQVAVYLTYATTAGHGVIDRELYLPQGWTDDPARCQAAGVPDQVGVATKPELARVMLHRALDAGVPAGWVTADEVYGNRPALRGWLETRQLPYVLAGKATEPLPPASGPPWRRPSWPSASRVSAGCASAPGRAPRAAAGRRGAGWHSAPPARQMGGSAGCWYAAAGAPGRWPTTCAPARPACRWSPWSGWPGAAGGWRRRSRPVRGWVAWTSTRSAAGAAGPGGDPGHAGLRVPGGGRGHRTRPPPTTIGPHPIDLQ